MRSRKRKKVLLALLFVSDYLHVCVRVLSGVYAMPQSTHALINCIRWRGVREEKWRAAPMDQRACVTTLCVRTILYAQKGYVDAPLYAFDDGPRPRIRRSATHRSRRARSADDDDDAQADNDDDYALLSRAAHEFSLSQKPKPKHAGARITMFLSASA